MQIHITLCVVMLSTNRSGVLFRSNNMNLIYVAAQDEDSADIDSVKCFRTAQSLELAGHPH